jgi:hypothetical protein
MVSSFETFTYKVEVNQPFKLDSTKFSTYKRYLNMAKNLFKVINNTKSRLKTRDPEKYEHFKVCGPDKIQEDAFALIVDMDQQVHFAEELHFFAKKPTTLSDIPPLVLKYNLVLDSKILRVKSKFGRWGAKHFNPIFLSKLSDLAEKLIVHYHRKLKHAGVYPVLNMMRKSFFIPHAFSLVKKIIHNCVWCRKVNGRTIQLNQSAYRDFRVNPPNVPFRSVFIDYLGPFIVKVNDVKSKIYLLCFSCLWSRAINLKLCTDLTVQQFIRAFQLHCFEHGMPEACHSDLGSQIVSGSAIIANLIADSEAQEYFRVQGVNPTTFTQFPKGCKELGGLVESCVKMIKRVLFGAIGKNILTLENFEFLTC